MVMYFLFSLLSFLSECGLFQMDSAFIIIGNYWYCVKHGMECSGMEFSFHSIPFLIILIPSKNSDLHVVPFHSIV